jgi:hypothetical protein
MKWKDYCQYLLVSQTNYTCTNFAAHHESFSHDQINRYIGTVKATPRMIWQKAKKDIIESENGYILFDDTVVDKNFSKEIELVRSQYSGNAHGIIKGIGVVTCVYVNPELNKYWIIDMRIFAPEEDGKTKIDHLLEMFTQIITQKKLSFKTLLIDSWYATKKIILTAEEHGKIYYAPLKKNRLVDDSGGERAYKSIDKLTWETPVDVSGKLVKINKFPKNHKVQLFRVTVSPNRTEFVITNDKACASSDGARNECAIRWKIEQLHREGKQLTGLEKCQCRKSRIQRNHILASWLVWLQLARVAYENNLSLYALKSGLLKDYLISELANPSILFSLS